MRKYKKATNSEKIYPYVEEWLKTGESKKDLCTREGIAIHVFDYWLRKYRAEKGEEVRPSDLLSRKIVPIEIKGKGDLKEEGIIINYSDGTEVRLPPNIPVAQIRFLLPIYQRAHV